MKKERVNQYESRVAYPTLILTLLAMAAYVLVFVAYLKWDLAATWAILLNSILAYLLFTPMHEASHLNISGKHPSLRWLDEMVGWLSGISLFAPFYIFKPIHFRHHAYTNDPEKDPDHWLASKNFLSLVFHSTTIFPVYMIKGALLLYSKEKVANKVKREIRIGFIGLFFLVMLLIILGLTIGWQATLQLWIFPAFIAQVFLAITFDWLPHHPHESKDKYQNTRVIDVPGLSILFLSQNYHLIHHLYPNVPFYYYKDVYDDIEIKLKEKGTEIIKIK